MLVQAESSALLASCQNGAGCRIALTGRCSLIGPTWRRLKDMVNPGISIMCGRVRCAVLMHITSSTMCAAPYTQGSCLSTPSMQPYRALLRVFAGIISHTEQWCEEPGLLRHPQHGILAPEAG